MYKILIATVLVSDKVKHSWERDLATDFAVSEWRKIVKCNRQFLMNVAIKATRYKLLNRRYLTPTK